MTIEIIIAWGIGVLGVLFYVFKTLHGKLREDRKLDVAKLVKENQMFWIITVTLNLIISIVLKVSPEASEVVGYAVNLDTNFGYLLIGYGLAGGTNVSPIGKKIQDKTAFNG